MCVREDGKQCVELVNAVKEFNENRNMEKVGVGGNCDG